MRMTDIKKVVLAYSGGLDTSVIVRWLQEKYSCEVITLLLILVRVKKLSQRVPKHKRWA